MSSADDSRLDGDGGGDNGGDRGDGGGRGGGGGDDGGHGRGGDDSQYSDNDQSIISSSNNNNNNNSNSNNNNNNNNNNEESDPMEDIKKRIIVRNLPKLYGWQDLKDIFRNIVGFVEFVELFKEDGDSCAVVEFRDAAFVPKAIKEMNGFKILNNNITVEEDDGTSKYDIKKPPPGTKSRRRRHEDRGGDRDEKFLKSRRSGGYGGGSDGIGGGIRGGSISSIGNDGPFNTYGLSISFLDSLGITGPLYPKVFVSNLDYHVDERKVKQIFKLAGKIINLDWSIDKEGNSRGFGVIEYSHPVEAVQAVSLFDRKLLYDRQMIVRIDRMAGNDDEFKLPEGLTNIGLGLGPNGQPFPQVAKTLRKTYNNFSDNNNFNYNPNNQNNQNNFNGMNNWNGGNNNFNNNNANNMMMGMNNNNNMMGMIQNIPTPVQPPQSSSLSIDTTNQMMSNNNNMVGGGLIGGGVNNDGIGFNSSSMGIIGNYDTISQNNTIRGYTTTTAAAAALSAAATGGGGGIGGSQISALNYQSGSSSSAPSMNLLDTTNIIGSVSVSDTIVIKNLPPSCDWQMLRDKFNEIGEVKFAEIRGNDCGIVRFVKGRDAELAIKLMDGARFDGHNIHVLLY